MKKIILVAALVLGFAAAAAAQPRAVGLRGGYGVEATYQHTLGANFLEANLGLGFGEVGYFNVGVAGQVGLEYTFWFPLQLSVDLRPQLGLVTASTKVEGETYRASSFGLWGWYPTLAVRYRF